MTSDTNAVNSPVAEGEEEHQYERSRWTKLLDDALEKAASAHRALEELHQEVSAYRDDFDPQEEADADFALLEEAADAVEA